MRLHLNEYFSKHLFATVESLQIQEDDLPEAFTTTILTAATSKQNITRMSKTMAAKIVEFQTARQIAEAQANVTIQKAIGDQHRIMQNGRADAAIIEVRHTWWWRSLCGHTVRQGCRDVGGSEPKHIHLQVRRALASGAVNMSSLQA